MMDYNFKFKDKIKMGVLTVDIIRNKLNEIQSQAKRRSRKYGMNE